MTSITVDGLDFEFPDDWRVLKWDDTDFHRKQFQNVGGGSKACDLVAMAPGEDRVWLIEAKDFRSATSPTSKDVIAQIACKARDTLAGLWAAGPNAGVASEGSFARLARGRGSVRVVFHLEDTSPSSLFPVGTAAANVSMKLRQALGPIDPNAAVSSTAYPLGMGWIVR